MITKADIKQETNSVSYNRGKKIYEEQKVHAFQVQEMEDIFGYQLHTEAEKICIVSAFL